MTALFLDTSALAKLYHPEAGSAFVEDLVLRSGAAIIISRLTVVEVQSVFARKIRSGAIAAADSVLLRRLFEEHMANEIFRVIELTRAHYAEAGALIQRHGIGLGLRTLDALQLAVALSLHRRGAAESLVASDKILCKVAGVEGMPVIDPESPAL